MKLSSTNETNNNYNWNWNYKEPINELLTFVDVNVL